MEMEISELTGMKTFGSVLTEWKEDYQPAILQRAKRWSKVCRDSPKVIGFPQEGSLWIELNELGPILLGFPAASGESSVSFNSVDAWIKWETFWSRCHGNRSRARIPVFPEIRELTVLWLHFGLTESRVRRGNTAFSRTIWRVPKWGWFAGADADGAFSLGTEKPAKV